MTAVVELLEGDLGPEAGDYAGVWLAALEAVREVLRGTTIAAVVEREAHESGSPMYYVATSRG